MTDLTDRRHEFMIFRPDVDTLAAIQLWHDKLNAAEKGKFKVDTTEGFVMSYPDATGDMDIKKDELVVLVKENATVKTDLVRVRFTGSEYKSAGIIVQSVCDPEDE